MAHYQKRNYLRVTIYKLLNNFKKVYSKIYDKTKVEALIEDFFKSADIN